MREIKRSSSDRIVFAITRVCTKKKKKKRKTIILTIISGKGRLYPAYSLSGSEGEENSPSLRGRAPPAYPQNNHQTTQSHLNHYNASQHKQRAYQQQQQHPLYHMPSTGAGLSDTPTSGNASDETLTDSDLITVARDSALLVHNGEWKKLFRNGRITFLTLSFEKKEISSGQTPSK